MALQALIFDFDGVLADSVELKTNAFEKLFEPFGDDVVWKVVDHHRNNGGVTRKIKIKYYFENFVKKKIDDQFLEEYCEKFSHLVVDNIVKAPEIKGSINFIKLNHKKIPCFINSATPDNELHEIVEKRKLNEYFKEILGSNNSKSQNLKLIVDEYKLDPSRCLFFGDTKSDYRAATKYGIPFVGILPVGVSPLLNEAPKVTWYHDFTEFNLNDLEVLIE